MTQDIAIRRIGADVPQYARTCRMHHVFEERGREAVERYSTFLSYRPTARQSCAVNGRSV